MIQINILYAGEELSFTWLRIRKVIKKLINQSEYKI